jgi:polygalacturonase
MHRAGVGGGDNAEQCPPATETFSVVEATGSGVSTVANPGSPFFDITNYGAVAGGSALTNQKAINDAIAAAATVDGGTVVVPSGEFKTYTIRLKSRVGLHLATKTSVIRAAIPGTGAAQDGGYYDAPEPNLFVGLQDHAHSHFANSLIYGADIDSVMISGPGLIDGSYQDGNGHVVPVLEEFDPPEVVERTAGGPPGGANKAIALKNSTNVTFRDFSLKNGGHLGIIGMGIAGWTIEGIVVDTNRDGLNVDSSQNVTIRHSVFNALGDDALVLKGSFGLGRYFPLHNVLIEHCTVSGYDPGSVIDGVYSTNRLASWDGDKPTARIKLGTEATTGFNTVTIRHVTFDRSRGFALESVDGADLRDIVLSDVKMKNVSSSPIFIRIGDRGRAPVTGRGTRELTTPDNTVRLDSRHWVLPDIAATYGNHPALRFVPSYNKNMSVPIGGKGTPAFSIVSAINPTALNPNAIHPTDPLFANAVGSSTIARAFNIKISNVTVEDADPRFPILIAGLVDHPVENVWISDITVEYRGGLKMEHAVEQRQLTGSYTCSAYQSPPETRPLHYLVNPLFVRNEALLPRIGWNPDLGGGSGGWENDPYNVPEMASEYPEPNQFGVLPAYGLYARHVKGLTVNNVCFKFKLEDERPAVVLDDVAGADFTGFTAQTRPGVPVFVKVTHTRKREANLEYVKDRPYKTTTVTGLAVPSGLAMHEVKIARPAPGTPPDSLYSHPTAPSASVPYAYPVPDERYPRPLTVHRPFFDAVPPQTVTEGCLLQITVRATNVASTSALTYSADQLPLGATFDPASRTLSWRPSVGQVGNYTVKMIAHDGVLPVTRSINIAVVAQRSIGPQDVPARGKRG